MRAFGAFALWALLAGLSLTSARAEVRVDVELVLAVDVSRSMTARELEIQRRGYAEALVSDEVIYAITSGFHGQVALAYVEWAGSGLQRQVVDWTLVRNAADASAIAAKLTAHFDSSMRRTSISGALDHASRMFDGNGFASSRQVIDISGDGPNNDGRPVLAARQAALAKGLTINGLPLMTREGMGARWHLDDLDQYYYHCVIGGFGAFVMPVLEWREFPLAVKRKLVLELSGVRPPAPLLRPVAGYDCLIGEKIWEQIMDDVY